MFWKDVNSFTSLIAAVKKSHYVHHLLIIKVILHYFAETARKFVALHFKKSISRSELAHIMHSSSRASGISRLTVKIKKKIIEIFSCFDSVILICDIYIIWLWASILSSSGLAGDKYSLSSPGRGCGKRAGRKGENKIGLVLQNQTNC